MPSDSRLTSQHPHAGAHPAWWLDPGFIAFDTETTGTDTAQARIVTAAAVRFEAGAVIEQKSWLLGIDIPIPPESTAVHGVTDERSQAEGQDQREALACIRDYLAGSGLPVVAFNSAFDFAMLAANLERAGLSPLPAVPVLCPYVIDKQVNKYVRGSGQRRLQPTAARYGIELTDDAWHNADGDALAAGHILLAELAAHASLRGMSPAELAANVAQWRTEQEADFQAWLARQPRR